MGHAGTNGAEGGDLVGRARVTAERLSPATARAFYWVGFLVPFLVFSAVQGVFSLITLLCLVPLVSSVALIVRDDVLHKTGIWWRRALSQVLERGSRQDAALIASSFASCSQRVMLAPYGYGY